MLFIHITSHHTPSDSSPKQAPSAQAVTSPTEIRRTSEVTTGDEYGEREGGRKEGEMRWSDRVEKEGEGRERRGD